MKWICILILFLSPFFIWGQKENVLFVSTQRLTTLNLSNIADKSTVISLNKKPGQHQSIWFSGQYIYLAGITNNVHQYHLSGQYIRTFKCGGYILGITWMQQYFMRDDTSYYKLSNIDCMSGDIEDLGVFHKDYYWAGFSIASTATFSIVNGRLFFSMGTDSTLYQVRGNRFEPYLRWCIEPGKRFLSERGC